LFFFLLPFLFQGMLSFKTMVAVLKYKHSKLARNWTFCLERFLWMASLKFFFFNKWKFNWDQGKFVGTHGIIHEYLLYAGHRLVHLVLLSFNKDKANRLFSRKD
jgi:hypothetical protein